MSSGSGSKPPSVAQGEKTLHCYSALLFIFIDQAAFSCRSPTFSFKTAVRRHSQTLTSSLSGNSHEGENKVAISYDACALVGHDGRSPNYCDLFTVLSCLCFLFK